MRHNMSEPHILVMGVAGSGKSTLAADLARKLGVPLIEGDDHHSPDSQDKMRRGIALEDVDRIPWLNALGAMLSSRHRGAVLTCSALRRHYRDRLRSAVSDLRIVYLDIDPDSAYARVTARVSHLFPPTLVRSQFEALESPVNEPDVLSLNASLSTIEQLNAVLAWLSPTANVIS